MNEVIISLVSVIVGATLSYGFQWLTEFRIQKKELRKEKIIAFQRLLKIDKLNGPNNKSMHASHFDNEAFINKVYSAFLDDYYYFPEEIRSKFDTIFWWLKESEINGIPNEVSSREFITSLTEKYIKAINNLEEELKYLID